MKTTLIACALILLIGWQPAPAEQPDTRKADRPVIRRLETAIANTILQDAARAYPTLQGSSRVSHLSRKFEQLQSSVDFNLVAPAIRRERDILAYLIASEESRLRNPDDFLARLHRLTSLNWSLADYEGAVTSEMNRLNEMLRQHKTSHQGIEAFRNSLTYPEDTTAGRQLYLDQLADAMHQSQLLWYDVLNVYSTSGIGFEGIEHDAEAGVFAYNPATGTLRINLSEVRNLPLFEVQSLALYYGFPGLHSLFSKLIPAGNARSGSPSSTLQSYLELPGYSLGWAGYISGFLLNQATDPERQLHHLYFQQLLTALALVDLRFHTRDWTDDKAVSYLRQTTPYEATRLTAMVREARTRPGYRLAALAGQLTLEGLYQACRKNAKGCNTARLHQIIVDLGPVPFDLLNETLETYLR